MVSENTDSKRASELRAEAADALDRRDDSNRLAALYGLTPKVESAIVAAIREGAEDRCRALVAFSSSYARGVRCRARDIDSIVRS